MKILVIEDDKELLYAIKTILTVEGYKVDTAETVTSGKYLIGRNIYDLVITDIMLPHWGGFDLVDAIKETDSSSNTPVLVITGMDEDILNTTNTFAERCLTKPFNKKMLLDTVEELLQAS